MALFFSRLSMAFCRYSVLFLVRNFLSVLVRGGNESHSNRTPDLRILDDLHSPRRFYQALQTLGEPLPASLHHKLAPLGGPAFFLGVKGFPLVSWDLWQKNLLLGCCGWRSSGSVGSAGHSERTAFLLGWLEAPTSGVPIAWCYPKTHPIW